MLCPFTGGHWGGHGVNAQLGSKGKVTNGAEKLPSQPIFMSAFPPAIRADKHLIWGGEEKKRNRLALVDSFFLN